MRSAGATRWVWGKRCLKFEDLNKGPRRLLAGDEQDLAKASVSSSIGSSLFCVLPARSPKNAPGPRFKRLRLVHRSISEFVTSRPATTISRRRLSMVAVAARPRSWRVVWTTCALRSCVLAMSNPEHRRARPASVHKLTDDGSGMKAPPALGLRMRNDRLLNFSDSKGKKDHERCFG
jgi:hypothetical protein